MPRIDPNQLLKCLSVLLSESGGIKSKDEVQRLASLMLKFSKKLVSKCIYVLILKSTEADLLDMFMSAGGWDLTFNWLSDGIQMKNWPLVAELVELLLLCPVDIERLKGNNCPKVIKNLSKDVTSTDRVRQLACSVVDQWLAIVKGACEASNTAMSGNTVPPEEQNTAPQVIENGGEIEDDESNDATSSRGVYKITIRDGKNVLAEVISSERTGESVDEKLDEDEEEVKEEKPETRQVLKVVNDDPVAKESLPPKKLAEGKKQTLKRKSEKKPPSPEPEKKYSKDKKKSQEKKPKLDLKTKSKEKKPADKSSDKSSRDKEKTPEEKAQEEKDKQNIMKLITPSIGGLGKIPKKSKDDYKKDDKKSSAVKPPADPKKPFPKDPKKYNISIETRKGGEDRPKTVKTFNSRFRSTGLEELPPPPKNPKKKEELSDKKSVKRSSPTKDLQQPPEKKAKEEEKPIEKPVPSVTTPPKPKVTGLQESDVFADALTAANVPKDVKKRKRRPSLSSSPGDAKKDGPAKTEEKDGKEAVKPVLKFYQDTLITSEEKADAKDEKSGKDESSETHDDAVVDDMVTDALSKEELEDEVAKAEEAINQVLKMEEKKNVEREKNRLPKGVLVYVRKSSKVKKSVSWKSEKELESIQYFELDETERVNVTKPFVDMKQMERINERILLSRKLVSEDIMEEKTPWRALIPIDIAGDLVIPGKNSVEKDVQRARERTTLQAIYFNRSLIPDSPAEPDLEIHANTDPAVIPLKDQTGNADSVISYRDKPWPEPKGYPPGSAGSPPHMSPPQEPIPPPIHGMPPPNVYPQQFQQPPMQPFMPNLMPGPEWMGNNDGNNMMVGGPQGNDPMMMGAMNPGVHPGLLPPPDMYHMGGPPAHPDFMAPPFPMGGPPMYQNGPPNYPPHQDPGPRHQRPWFRGGGGNNINSGGGSWRHQSKGGWNPNHNNGKMCKFYMKKGICRQNNCTYRHGSGKGSIR